MAEFDFGQRHEIEYVTQLGFGLSTHISGVKDSRKSVFLWSPPKALDLLCICPANVGHWFSLIQLLPVNSVQTQTVPKSFRHPRVNFQSRVKLSLKIQKENCKNTLKQTRDL